MTNVRIKTWVEFTGKSVEAILKKQYDLKLNGTATKKNIGIVANMLMNEMIEKLNNKKD